MKNKRGWIKILEVFLAILLIMGSMLIIISRKAPETDISDEIYAKQRQILDIISKNNSLRDDIVAGNSIKVNQAISALVPNSWNFTTSICNINDMCNNPASSDLSLYEQNVYSTEVVVTSNLTSYSPKKLRFFVWMK